MSREIVTLKEAANLLKISIHTAYKVWPGWRDYNVRVLKLRPNATPRFYVSDLFKMLEAPK